MHMTVKHTPCCPTEYVSEIYNLTAMKQEAICSHQCGTVPPTGWSPSQARFGAQLAQTHRHWSSKIAFLHCPVLYAPCRHTGSSKLLWNVLHCVKQAFAQLLHWIFLNWSSVQIIHKVHTISNYSTVCGHAAQSFVFCSSYSLQFHVFLHLLSTAPTCHPQWDLWRPRRFMIEDADSVTTQLQFILYKTASVLYKGSVPKKIVRTVHNKMRGKIKHWSHGKTITSVQDFFVLQSSFIFKNKLLPKVFIFPIRSLGLLMNPKVKCA